MMNLQRKFRVEEITREVQQSIKEIQDYASGVVAKNAPIRRLKGMDVLYGQLVEIRDESWWYSKDLATEMHPKQAVTRAESHAQMGLRRPFHCELYVKLHPAYTTFDILETKLKKLKTVLDAISTDLAFSGLEESTSEETRISTQAPDKAAKAAAHPPKAFVAHGGKSAARDNLEDFLMALGIAHIIVEEQPSEARSKDKNVEYYLKQCDCAVILATKGDVDGRTGELIPRGNILIEIGRCQEILPDRTIYLLEEETKFPTNIDEKVWERFSEKCMDKALIKVAKELRAFGLIEAMKR